MPFYKRKSFPCLSQPSIPLKEHFISSPWKKWRLYGRFPFKLITHFVLLVLVVSQTLYFASVVNDYDADASMTLLHFYMPDAFQSRLQTGIGTELYYYYEIPKFLESMSTVVHDYFTMSNRSLGHFSYVDANKKQVDSPPPVEMELKTYKNLSLANVDYTKPLDKTTVIQSFSVNETHPLGPFNASVEGNRKILDSFVSVDLRFRLQTSDISEYRPKCIVWVVTIKYAAISSGGTVRMSHSSIPSECDHDIAASPWEGSFLLWTSLLIGLLSGCSFVLVWKAIIREYKIYRKTKHRLIRKFSRRNSGMRWNDLSVRERMSLFNLWHILFLVSNVLQFVSSLYVVFWITNRSNSSSVASILVGLSAIATCISITRYFEFAPKFNVLLNSLRTGMPNVLRFVLGVTPIFFGYALLGTVLFGSYCEYFASLDRSAVTLFAVLNGDVIHDTFDRLYSTDASLAIISRIYLYTFTSLFIYAVLNIFILIMEDAFFTINQNNFVPIQHRVVDKVPLDDTTSEGTSSGTSPGTSDNELIYKDTIVVVSEGEDDEGGETPILSHMPNGNYGAVEFSPKRIN